MVGQQVQLLSRELQTLRAQTERLLDGMQTLEDEMRGLTDGQARAHAEHAEVRTRTRRTQALVARTYEALQGWPEALERARGAEDYEEPYTERFPLVSIPIPTFHSPGTLCERALASVLAQTHEHGKRSWSVTTASTTPKSECGRSAIPAFAFTICRSAKTIPRTRGRPSR